MGSGGRLLRHFQAPVSALDEFQSAIFVFLNLNWFSLLLFVGPGLVAAIAENIGNFTLASLAVTTPKPESLKTEPKTLKTLRNVLG